jgi:hypothetical protein
MTFAKHNGAGGRITAAMAALRQSSVAETDNELCCHDTTMSASPLEKFGPIAQRGTIAALNAAWGNVLADGI